MRIVDNILKRVLIILLVTVGISFLNPKAQAQKPELYVKTAHSKTVNSVAFNKDGTLLASASDDETVKLWNVESRTEILTLYGHTSNVNSVAFSPHQNILASASHDKTIKLWNIETGKEIRTLNKHLESVKSIAFSPDGLVLASASRDKTIKIWKVSTGEEIRTLKGHKDDVGVVVFSPDGKTILSGSWDGTIRVWNPETGDSLKTLAEDMGHIKEIKFSPDGKYFTSSGRFWETVTRNEFELFQYNAYGAIAFSPEGSYFANSGGSNEIRLLKTQKDAIPVTLTQTKLSRLGSVESAAFSPNGKLLATGGSDKTVRFWDLTRLKENQLLDENFESINSLAVSPSGEMVAAGNGKANVKVWELATGSEKFVLKAGRISVNSVAFSPDGSKLASSGDEIVIWDAGTGKEIRRLPDQDGFFNSIAFSADGKSIVGGGTNEHVVKVWDVETGDELRTLRGHSKGVQFIAISPDGRKIAGSADDGKTIIWNAENGKIEFTVDRALQGRTIAAFSEAIAFSPDGKYLAVAGSSISLHDSETGREIKRFNGSAYGQTSFSPDSKLLTTTSANELYFWSVEEGTENVRRLTGHRNAIRSIIFTPDGKQLISGSRDNSIRIWNLENDVLERLSPQGFYINSIAFSTDFTTLAFWGPGNYGEIVLWDLKNGRRLPDVVGGNIIQNVAFHPTKPLVAHHDYDGRIVITDINAKRQYKVRQDSRIKEKFTINSLRFSKDGRTLLLHLDQYTAEESFLIWDYETDKLELKKATPGLKDEVVKNYPLDNLAFLLQKRDFGNGVYKIDNSKVTLYHPETQKELCSLITLEQGEWLVTTPEGLFDGTPNAWNSLLWRFDKNTFNYAPVEAFFKEFYRPGLLQDIIAGNEIEPPAQDLSKIDTRQPSIKFRSIDGKSTDSAIESTNKRVRVEIEITDNKDKGRRDDFPESSNANDVRLFRNGSLVRLWDKNAFELTDKDGCRQFPATVETPKRAVCETDVEITAGDNEFTAYGFNHDNVKSNDAKASVTGAAALKQKGQLRVLAIGVDKYQNGRFDLKFAVKDAVDFGVELRNQQAKLGNFETPNVVQLTDKDATKQNILYALERLAKGDTAVRPEGLSAELDAKFAAIEKTRPEDVVMIYFAGHGTAAKDRFYLIPTDGFPPDNTDSKERLEQLQSQSISDLELEAVFRELDASQILFVIDACNSGQALEAEEKRRGPMNSKGLAQLAYEKGMYILTAAQSFQAALEVSQTPTGKTIEHGLLTYSLLEGMNTLKADGNEDKSISEREWFSFAVAEVPKMQVEAMRKRSAEVEAGTRDVHVYILGGDNNKKVEERALQTPRVFYRRETSANPLIISRP